MKDAYQEQFAQFNVDIAAHVVSVLQDSGLYRHLHCSSGSFAMSFNVVTWPGHLCYAGDMGCFVFSRLPDMFEFFRGRRAALVDRGYLAEKAVAADKSDGIRTYSEALFQESVRSDFDAFVESEELAKAHADQLWQRIQDEVLSRGDSHHDAVEAAMEFRWALADERGRQVFTDFWEHRLEDYTPRFWWCCYAIPWAIEQYDAQRGQQPKEEAKQ